MLMASSSISTARSERRSNKEIDYEGRGKYCNCRERGLRVKAPRWTSWTDDNPGRRFYACPNYEVKGCGFFEWHDPAVRGRAREMINELKLENRLLMQENRKLKSMSSVGFMENELDDLWLELQSLKDFNLKENERLKKKMKVGYCFAVVAWVLILILLIL